MQFPKKTPSPREPKSVGVCKYRLAILGPVPIAHASLMLESMLITIPQAHSWASTHSTYQLDARVHDLIKELHRLDALRLVVLHEPLAHHHQPRQHGPHRLLRIAGNT